MRGTFAGAVYQLGNPFASANAVFRAEFAQSQGGNCSTALAVVIHFAALLIVVMMYLGQEAKDAEMGRRTYPLGCR